MLLLTSTADKIQVITDTASLVNVHASWVDHNAGTITPGRANTVINSITTTDVVASPAASTQRNVQTLTVKNRDSSVAVVTIQHTDGTTIAQLYSGVLLAGDQLIFMDGVGFQLTGSIDTQARQRLNTDFTTVSATTALVSGLSKVLSIGSWAFRHSIVYRSSIGSVGLKIAVNFTGTAGFFVANYRWVDSSNTTSTSPSQNSTTAGGTIMSAWSARAPSTAGFVGVGVDAINADMLMIIEGLINVTTGGNIEVWAACETAVGSPTVTISAGSALWLEAYGA